MHFSGVVALSGLMAVASALPIEEAPVAAKREAEPYFLGRTWTPPEAAENTKRDPYFLGRTWTPPEAAENTRREAQP
ncbi:unnamed protein product [Cercospora beticola]|nr:unnamed protein product [Cercospora beticola]